jgi:hypothetical protein
MTDVAGLLRSIPIRMTRSVARSTTDRGHVATRSRGRTVGVTCRTVLSSPGLPVSGRWMRRPGRCWKPGTAPGPTARSTRGSVRRAGPGVTTALVPAISSRPRTTTVTATPATATRRMTVRGTPTGPGSGRREATGECLVIRCRRTARGVRVTGRSSRARLPATGELTREPAARRPTRAAAPMRRTRTLAAARPIREPAATRHTRALAAARPTRQTAGVRPTRETAAVRTSTPLPVRWRL